MRTRESGMPDEEFWESLFDTEFILDRLGVDGSLGDVVELGCGYGTFSLSDCLRPDGRAFAIHWRFDRGTPRGPSLQIRPRPEQLADWATQPGLSSASLIIDLPP